MSVQFLPNGRPSKSADDSEGPAETFSELIRPHLPALSRLAFRFTGSQADAEDLLQELITRLYARAERLKNVDDLRPWLARALHNLYVDQRRNLARSPHGHLLRGDLDEPADVGLPHQDSSCDPTCCAETRLLGERLEELLARLPEVQRVVVVLHDVEGYRLDEIAGIVGVAIGTVKSRLFRAHEKLRQQLQQGNFSPSSVVWSHETIDSRPGCGILTPRVADDEL